LVDLQFDAKILVYLHIIHLLKSSTCFKHCYHHAPTVKPETATAVVELLMMGVRTPETC
jgi:hypothetical protein